MGLIFAAVIDVNQMKERFEERSARALPFFPSSLLYCTVQLYYAVCTYGALFLSHCSITYNVSLPFHDQVFYAVVAAKRFMPLSSVVHALISLSDSFP